MPLGSFNATIVNAAGDVVPGAEVEVRRTSDSGLATLFSDASRTAMANPFNANATTAFAQFFAERDTYTVAASTGSGTVTWTVDITPSSDGATYAPTRAEALLLNVPAPQDILFVRSSAGLLAYQRDAAGTALTTAGGQRWAPASRATPEHFGANGDGVANDTAAFQAAFDYAETLDGLGKVFGKSGATYNCGAITAECGVSFEGNGCTIRATSNSWLSISDGVGNSISVVENFRLRATLAPIVGSVGVSFESSAYNTRRGLILRNANIYGDDGLPVSAFGFEKYVRVTNAAWPLIEELRITGTVNASVSGPGPASQFVTTGVSLEGQTIGPAIYHARIASVYTGIKASSLLQEGLQLFACLVAGVRDAYDLRAAVFGGPGMWLANCHSNATRKGFDLGRRPDVSLTGCTAYKSDTIFREDYIGFDLEGAFGVQMTSCQVVYSAVAHPVSKGVRLLNSSGVTGSANTFRNTKIAISHEGGCEACTWDATSFMGSGTYTETCFATAGTDDKIALGPHQRASNWSAPYVVATPKVGITIDRGSLRYNRVEGQTVTEATTIVLTVEGSAQMQRIGLTSGAGAYDCTIELSSDLALVGDFFDIWLNLPSAADRRVIVKSGVGGSIISTIFTASSSRYSARYVFNGTNWIAHSITQSVFM